MSLLLSCFNADDVIVVLLSRSCRCYCLALTLMALLVLSCFYSDVVVVDLTLMMLLLSCYNADGVDFVLL